MTIERIQNFSLHRQTPIWYLSLRNLTKIDLPFEKCDISVLKALNSGLDPLNRVHSLTKIIIAFGIYQFLNKMADFLHAVMFF